MDVNKFTQKSLQAVQNCQKIAYEYGNQEIDQEHLLYSLLTMEDSLIAKLLNKMEMNSEGFVYQAEKLVAKADKGFRPGAGIYERCPEPGADAGETEAKQMDDEYISVEHLFLALLAVPNKELKTLFKNFNVTQDNFLLALSSVRGTSV